MDLCGIDIKCVNSADLYKNLNNPQIVVTVNAEAIVRSQHENRLKEIINSSITTIDGQIPLWLFKHKYKGIEIEKISGSELIYSLPQYSANNHYKVFLLGGQPESNEGAVNKLKQLYPTLEIKGYSPPYSPYPFPDNINEEILIQIQSFKPDFLFVGFGMGKQEFWEFDNFHFLAKSGVKLIIGCGGSFDFASGKIKRAPLLIQRCGLEGVWRLFKEFKWFRIKRLLISSKIFYYYLTHEVLQKKNYNIITK